ncbi:WD40-repeat-containing domain protein [Obelidium mucronatum]|nr:WD40-repeat-containing domain protein [Obelidium mucronatum]
MAANSTLNIRLRDAFELLKEKDGVIQILKDEMAALQLELVQREEQLKNSSEQVKKLESENSQLVDRWVKLKQEEASRMNEANEFVEAALKSKQAETIQRQSSRDIQFEDATKAEKTMQCSPPTIAIKKVSLHDGEINCIQVNRDGSLIATGGNDKKLILTDARTGAVKSSLIGSLQAVMSVSFSLDGDLVMGTSNDNSVKIWSISTSRLRHTLTGHIGKVFSAKFTDTNRVISGSHDRTLKVWDLNKGYCLRTIFTLSSCNDLDLLDGEGLDLNQSTI